MLIKYQITYIMSKTLRIPRWQRMLIEIFKASTHNRYGSYLIRVLGGSRTHIRYLLSKLERQGLVLLMRLQNRKTISLTDRGEKIAKAVMELQMSFKPH
jgi:Mn-dependent DtxR family transcriptional regulator